MALNEWLAYAKAGATNNNSTAPGPLVNNAAKVSTHSSGVRKQEVSTRREQCSAYKLPCLAIPP